MTRDTFDLFTEQEAPRTRFGDSDSLRKEEARKSDLIDLEVVFHFQTPPRGVNPGAVLVSNDGDETRAVWIPKSVCEIDVHTRFVTGKKKSGLAIQLHTATLTCSENVAKGKGLI